MIHIFLPAYNEERTIGKLIQRLIEFRDETDLQINVIVVDDGSTDTTKRIIEEFKGNMPIKIITHEKNKGLGGALKTGLLYISSILKDKDILITMDADNTHDPRIIRQMLDKIEEGYDVVIASRYEKGGEEIGVPLLRKILSRGASLVLRILFPIKNVKDYTSGYRAFRAAILKKLLDKYQSNIIEESGFVCMTELLLKTKTIGAKIGEVALPLRYDLKEGKSKMKIKKTILQYIRLVYKFR